MGKGARAAGGDPERHTAVITDVPMMWQKLAWDIDQFDDIQRSYPDMAEPLAFAAINVCISAASLADWASAAFISRRRAEGRPIGRAEVLAHIHATVPQQVMCEAIANTAKHSRFDEREWVGGEVRLDWSDGNEDEPPGYLLRHIHADNQIESVALNAFGVLERNWWGALQTMGFALPATHSLEWRQRRLQGIFGTRP